MKTNPKHLILDLLLALDGRPLAVRHAIRVCAVFGISANSLRVTLARLLAQGLIQTVERGAYCLGPAGVGLAEDVSTWRSVQQRLRPWQGAYVAVHCGALGRSDRAALRQRERALQMLGFCELDPGLYVRPDNLEPGVDGLRLRLHRLGLDDAAAVFQAQHFDAGRQARIRQLWSGDALTQAYRAQRHLLDDWLQGSANLALDVALRESFALGGQAIRQIVFDPLLPEPFVDVAERSAFIAAVHRFDAAGRATWDRFFDTLASEAP